MKKVAAFILLYACITILLLAGSVQAQQAAAPAKPAFTFEEVMIPMRDGAHLQTVVLAPSDQQRPLSILFRRTPYGVPRGPLPQVPLGIKDLAQHGYIFVIQNLRGRFK